MRINTKASRREGKTLAQQAMSLAQEEAEERRERILCEWDERLAAEKEAAIETEGPMRLWQVTRTCRGGYGEWTDAIDTLEVIEIGAAAEGIEQGTVLCASFHAG